MSYKVVPFETDKNKIPQIAAAKKQILPRFPFSWIISGASGSGKTQLLLNVLNRDIMYKDYFHVILIFSPTAGQLDDLYNVLNLPKENFIKKFDKQILKNILNSRYDLITKKGIDWVAKNSRVCLLFDDMISERLMNTPEMLEMFTLLRHYLCSVIVASQSFKKVPRSVRVNANWLTIFPALKSEATILEEEICPVGLTKKEFFILLDYCTQEEHDFLGILNHASKNKKIRKNLDEIINLKDMFNK